MSAPTKGPYVVDGLCVYGPKDPRSRHKNGRVLIGGVVTERQDWHGCFGEIQLPQHTEESLANAHLLAASWEMREALERLVLICENANNGAFDNGVKDPTGSIDQGDVWASEAIEQARAALAKAQGQ